MRKFQLILLITCSVVSAVLAQSQPLVEIALSQPTAQQGDIVTADVYIRNATNIGGADIGMTIDSQCLKIVDRQPGDFLPTTNEEGGFTPLSELNEHDTRLAAAIIDRSKLGNGDGIFFRTQLEVTCEQGVAALNVTFAEFSAYQDPQADEIELVSYTLGAGTVTTVNAQLVVGSADQAPDAAISTPETSSVPSQVVDEPTSPIMSIIGLILVVITVLTVVVLFWFIRRGRE